MSVKYRTWGAHLIDSDPEKPETPFTQMEAAMSTEPCVGGALMPDAHLGYGLPVGGVYALDNAVCPYAVGPDIACRMKITVLPLPPSELVADKQHLIDALNRRTFFGTGGGNTRNYDDPVLDLLPWSTSKPILENLERAKVQLGTSGSGNHFVEFGIFDVPFDGTYDCNATLQLEPGKYVAVMSHSCSRGTGFQVCKYYSEIAAALHPELVGQQAKLGWIDLDTEHGRDYWDAMTLMGQYAQANHNCIHNALAEYLGVTPIAQIENHHNLRGRNNMAVVKSSFIERVPLLPAVVCWGLSQDQWERQLMLSLGEAMLNRSNRPRIERVLVRMSCGHWGHA